MLELGLGNGRTYDHLRGLFPDREIFVFDRHVAAHPDCRPDPEHMIEGDFRDTLPAAGARLPAPAAFAHCDIGSGRPEADRAVAAFVGPALDRLLARGAVVVSDQAFELAAWTALDPPSGVEPGRYFMYRAGSA